MVYIVILVLLILTNALFAASEIAVISLNDAKIEKMAEDGNKKAKTILKLVKNPSNFLATIQIGVTLSGFFSSAIAADNFADSLAGLFVGTGISYATLRAIAFVVITLALSFVTLVFGELVPKRIAMKKSEQLSFAVCGLLYGLSVICKPVVFILSKTTNGVARLFGVGPQDDTDEVTEEEIRMMIDVGKEKGSIEEMEGEMINNVFEFDDITVEEVMTHRTDVTAVSTTDTLEEIVELALSEGYSRLPVYEEDIDNIIGILYIKDLLKLVGKTQVSPFSARDYMRPAFYIPESNKCNDLFKEMTARKIQMAIVVDEYGGTSGIVTMEDLLESIVGEIQDEFDNEDEEISQIGEHAFLIDGATNIEDVNEALDISIPESEDYDSLGGYILSVIGRIPTGNDHAVINVDDVTFTILTVEERRIAKVKAVKSVTKVPVHVEQAEKEEKSEKQHVEE
ncbi:MAG TPA: hemolysin family protein [Firmicutes bacterium]|nr:hemolysin family protein [Bacillota bacterium]